ncbi:hypothetical protein BDK88_2476 [Natrinema hispanicum]|uniref:Uncharacterized protein n=1 Tax=Natrinema hispanicum TaxID=392421 RepID=A0A482YEQ2_9EURY|nr:hypothetical protein [Natrinema hispanicum]RZV11231.1 hypothetical protein BDK88_2476 [Natrinema hispanicum]
MGDKKFTLIELHFDGDTQFGPGTIGETLPIGSTEPTAETDSETETESEEGVAAADDSGGRGKSAVGALVALAVLVGIAVAAKKFRGGSDEEDELESEEEPDVIVT